MSWLGLLLVGIGLTDLAFSLRPRPRVAEAVGGGVVLLLAGLGGLLDPRDPGTLVGVVVLTAAVVLWGESVTYGFRTGRVWVPLVVLATQVGVVLLATGAAPRADGVLGALLRDSELGLLAGVDADRALLVAGVLLVQLSTGNVVVRLVLAASGTTNPLRAGGQAPALKGGRLLGPMERLVIVGLGLAGEVTAASIVIAAKGLLRFPELQAARNPGRSGPPGPGIHEVTEYFLVGSFVSWLVSLASLALLA